MEPRPPVIRNLAVVSDLHCGSQLGLCPPVAHLDGGGTYRASRAQRRVYAVWLDYWRKWLPEVTHGEPFAVEVNGDCLDGRHHGSTDQISQNLTDQAAIAYELLAPVRDLCEGRLYMVRGTEAHVGASAQHDEELAEELDAVPDKEGRFARYELRIRVGDGLVHVLHHIGTTGSMAYETTALMQEYSESVSEAGRGGIEPPQVVVRSHRHRHAEIRVPTSSGYGVCFTTAAWQLKTPFVWKIPGGRITSPQLGGSLIRQGDTDLFTRHKVWDVPRTPVEVVCA
jgi:hypothetical protein